MQARRCKQGSQKIKYPVLIYNRSSQICGKSQIKHPETCRFFSETRKSVKGFEVTRTSGSLIPILSNQNRRFFYWFFFSSNIRKSTVLCIHFFVAKFCQFAKSIFKKRIFYKNSLFFWKQIAKIPKKLKKLAKNHYNCQWSETATSYFWLSYFE